MRIGFVTVTTGTGGMERYLLRLIACLPAGVQAVVFVRSGVPGDLHDRFAASGAELDYGRFGYGDPVRSLRLFRRLRRARLDALVDLTGVFSGPTLAIARLAGIPARAPFHRRSTFAFPRSPLRLAFARASLTLAERAATAILANSRAALETFHPRLGHDPRLAVIPNMIEPAEIAASVPRAAMRARLGLSEDACVALHVGRVDPAKDHPTLLRALVAAMAREARLHAVLAGPGTRALLARYRDIVPSALDPRFHLLGNRTDVADLYAASDLFVFPSITEGQPNALLEAMLAGLPVIASAIAPIREIVPARGHPLLVEPGDHLAFAEAILRCADGGADAALRRYAEETVRLTDPARIVPALLARLEPRSA